MASPGARAALFAEALAWRGRIDVVVVNAATLLETPFDGSDEIWDENWAATLQVNVLEPVEPHARGGAPLPRRAAAARSSRSRAGPRSAARRSRGSPPTRPRRPRCGTSRRRSRAITRRTAILAYVVAPGIVQTPMSEISAVARGGIDAVNAALAMGEMVPPEEVAELIAFLATGRSRHLSGATIDVNGATYIR